MSKPKLDLQKLTDDEVKTLAKTVSDSMTANAAKFPASAATVALLDAARGTFTTSLQIYVDGKSIQQTKTAQKNTDRSAVEDLLRKLAADVTEVAKTDAAAVTAAGMTPASAGGPVTMGQVTGMSATPGDVEGSINWMCDPKKGALFLLETSADVTPRVWVKQNPSKVSSGMIGSLPSLSRVWVRAAAMGSNNTGPWSDPALVAVP